MQFDKRHKFILLAVIGTSLLIYGCTGNKKTFVASTSKKTAPTSSSFTEISTGFLAKQNYAWLTSKAPIPQYILDEATQYRSDFLKKNSESASNLTFVFFYNNDGDACLEATVTPKGRYTWEKGTWICQWWSGGGGQIGIGEIKYSQTKKIFR
jgi:hypothetical protein